GYLARAAFIMDRLMSKVGLHGKSFIPLLSSFACAIPGNMATRTIENRQDRFATILVAPLMSCSARLPIYTLFIAAFLPTGTLLGLFSYQGIAMFSMYLLGTVLSFFAAWVLSRFVFKGDSSFFAMELPPYRLPRLRQILWRMIDRSKAFFVRAGKIIFWMSILLWLMARYPSVELDPSFEVRRIAVQETYDASVAAGDDGEAAALIFGASIQQLDIDAAGYRIERSFIGMMGHALEPVMRPLGFDWKISAGIISAFVAREVIISALATIYSVGDSDENSPILREKLKADRYPDGSPVYTPLVAASLLVFFVLALQCMSTLAIARRETNTWKWPLSQLFGMTAIAYIVALIAFQLLK
ncbi:ferrous iron transporter B, partial [candidate division KSB1 bacterium]|nr:ferrous iron transporter B [candidate division KSB1 bacterium]